MELVTELVLHTTLVNSHFFYKKITQENVMIMKFRELITRRLQYMDK